MADHSVAKLSGRLFLPHFTPSGPIGMRSYSGAVPLPLMLSSEVVYVINYPMMIQPQ